MPVLLSSKVVRLALNVASYGPATDVLANAPVKFPKADLRLEVAAFYGKIGQTQQLVDVSNWVSLTCTFKAMGNGGAAPAGDGPTLAEATVLAGAMNPTMTAEQWAALTHQQVAFDFTEAQINNLSVGQVWCVFTALLNTGKVIPVQFGPMEVVEDGYASGGTAAVEAGTAYSKAEALALFALRERNDITARTGGGAGKLDGIITAAGAWPIGQSVRTRSGAGGGREEWILEVGTDAEAATQGLVRPDDYAPLTNECVWRQIL